MEAIESEIIVLSIIFLLFLVALPNFVTADVGPKPTMTFKLNYNTSQPVSLLSGAQCNASYQVGQQLSGCWTLLDCRDKDCINAKPLSVYGPQRFVCAHAIYNPVSGRCEYAGNLPCIIGTWSWAANHTTGTCEYNPTTAGSCTQDFCYAMAYGFAPYEQLVLNFTDKARASNIFSTASFNAIFDVRITDSQLIVQEVTPLQNGNIVTFLQSLIITLIIELLVAWTYLKKIKIPLRRPLISVTIANLISVPIVWFVFLGVLPPAMIPLGLSASEAFIMFYIVAEIFAIIFEAFFIHITNKSTMSWQVSLKLSLFMNIASLLVGGLISFISVL